MAIDIYEDNAGGIVLVNTNNYIGLIIGYIGTDPVMWNNAKDDCYGFHRSDEPTEDYEREDVVTNEQTLNEYLPKLNNIATWYGPDTSITVWSKLPREDRPVGCTEPGISGKWYLGIS